MADNDQNIVMKKMTYLEERFEMFSSESEKTLLVWLTKTEDVELVDGFLRFEQEGFGDNEDFFIILDSPFDEPESYPLALVENLKGQYEGAKPAIVKQGFDASWRCPERNADESATVLFSRALGSFCDYYKELVEQIIVALRPQGISDPAAWSDWLSRLLFVHSDRRTRFLVLDDKSRPLLDELSERQPQAVHQDEIDLDYPGMLEALANGEGDQNSPDAKFRVLFVKLSNQAEKKDIEGVKQTAALALSFAKAQGWHQMQVVVYMVVGACHLQNEDPDAALESYRAATGKAREAKEAEDLAGTKMEVQCLLAEGSVLFTKREYLMAAEIYREAASLAEQAGDSLLALEGWRMAAYCYEMEEQLSQSVRCGGFALNAGEIMSEDQRALSTLAYAGDGLIRVIKTAKKKHRAEGLPDEWEIEERMERLLGDDWREGVVTNTQEGEPS